MPFNLPIVGEIFWNLLLIKEPYLCSLPRKLKQFYFVVVQQWQRNVQKKRDARAKFPHCLRRRRRLFKASSCTHARSIIYMFNT